MDLAKRTVLREKLTSLVDKAKEYLTSPEAQITKENEEKWINIEEELNVLSERLNAIVQSLEQSNLDVRHFIKETDFDEECKDIIEYNDQAITVLSRINNRLEKLKRENNLKTEKFENAKTSQVSIYSGGFTPQRSQISELAQYSVVHLPKLHLKKFSGDYREWLPFWEQFRSTIHENHKLSAVDKFNYLQSLLTHKAADTIAGFTPSESCYASAINLLIEEFGDREKIIDKNLQQLMNLPIVTNKHDLNGLRRLYNMVVTTTRSLTALEVHSSQYFIMLKPVLLKSLPEELRLMFYRKQNLEIDQRVIKNESDNDMEAASQVNSTVKEGDSTIDDILKFIKHELTSLEKAEGGNTRKMVNHVVHNVQRKVMRTAAGLISANVINQENCFFCKSKDHHERDCKSDIPIEEKKQMLKRYGRCYRCLRRGHNSKQCRSNHLKCDKCKGKHATSVCDPQYSRMRAQSTNESTNIDINKIEGDNKLDVKNLCSTVHQQSTKVYLQTACVFLSSPSDNLSVFVRLVLDNGSQRTYITKSISRKLNLPFVEKIKMRIAAFGRSNLSEELIEYDCVAISVKSQYEDKVINMIAIVVPDICADILPVPHINNKGIMKLKLADNNLKGVNCEPGINLLIGADYYWSIVSCFTQRISDKLVAVDTLFGWTIVGPAQTESSGDYCDKNCGTSEIINTESLCTLNEFKNLWDLESIGIVDVVHKDNSMNNVDNYIKKQGERYEASLYGLIKKLY